VIRGRGKGAIVLMIVALLNSSGSDEDVEMWTKFAVALGFIQIFLIFLGVVAFLLPFWDALFNTKQEQQNRVEDENEEMQQTSRRVKNHSVSEMMMNEEEEEEDNNNTGNNNSNEELLLSPKSRSGSERKIKQIKRVKGIENKINFEFI
jgi:uncharacterized membrane protein YhiD involved in acid resistance